ncbi:MAG: cation diffusion facilitator family transporter [Ketobacteraceae bacterium]|nr:cation diffusion facilitator family transporter [Ketobacteraceae bacterium]
MTQISQEETHRLLKITSAASVLTAVVLIIAKLVAWGMSGSVGLLASLVDSLMDAAASIVNLVAIRYALQPADNEHRFGHGKAESLAGLGQATFIAGSAVFLFLHAIDRFINPRDLKAPEIAVAVMVFSIVATSLLLILQRYTVKKTHSVAIKADSLHYAADLLTNVAIVVAILLSIVGWPGFDPLAGLAISLFIFYSAFQVGHEAVQHLLDRELPDEEKDEIVSIATEDPLVLGIHELRTRQSGPIKMIQMHLELDGDMKLKKAHEIADAVEKKLSRRFPGADVIIHQDPFGLKELHVQPGEFLVDKPSVDQP